TDLQYQVQQMVSDYAKQVRAAGARAVVMDAHTGEVLALADDKSYDLSAGKIPDDQQSDPALSQSYEPGSVNKIVMGSAAVESGVAKPDTVTPVPDKLQNGDGYVHDAWTHPEQNFTLTGILGKSSNVGTVKTAEKIGKDAYLDMLRRF